MVEHRRDVARSHQMGWYKWKTYCLTLLWCYLNWHSSVFFESRLVIHESMRQRNGIIERKLFRIASFVSIVILFAFHCRSAFTANIQLHYFISVVVFCYFPNPASNGGRISVSAVEKLPMIFNNKKIIGTILIFWEKIIFLNYFSFGINWETTLKMRMGYGTVCIPDVILFIFCSSLVLRSKTGKFAYKNAPSFPFANLTTRRAREKNIARNREIFIIQIFIHRSGNWKRKESATEKEWDDCVFIKKSPRVTMLIKRSYLVLVRIFLHFPYFVVCDIVIFIMGACVCVCTRKWNLIYNNTHVFFPLSLSFFPTSSKEKI